MASQIRYNNLGSDYVYVNAPQWGYDTYIHLPFTYIRRSDNNFKAYDRGPTRDVRICKCQHLLNAADANNLLTFLEDNKKARANQGYLYLSDAPIIALSKEGGFTPFGPDLGDAGRFDITYGPFSPSKQLHNPWLWWTLDMLLLMRDKPTYNLPDMVSDGTVTIGNVDDIRYPRDGYDTEYKYEFVSGISWGKNHYAVDNGQSGDAYYCEPEISGTKSKIAELLNEIVTNIRATEFTFDPSNVNYPFGRSNSSGGPYTAIIGPNPTIRVKHAGHDRYRMKLGMIMRVDNG